MQIELNFTKMKFPYLQNMVLKIKLNQHFLREVQLPSGGVIVIDHTEALVSVDVNSSRSTKGRSIENTALSTNLEAADEVAKQLRLERYWWLNSY